MHYEARHRANLNYSQRLRRVAPAVGSVALCLSVIHGIANHEVISSGFSAIADQSELSQETERIAEQMLGQNVLLTCDDSKFENDATSSNFAYVPHFSYLKPSRETGRKMTNLITIREYICEDAVDAVKKADGTDLPSVDESFALSVLSHEGGHVSGTLDEAKTQCFAIQKLPGQLKNLGFDLKESEIVTDQAINRARSTITANYFSDECKKGGDFDLAISDQYFDKYGSIFFNPK